MNCITIVLVLSFAMAACATSDRAGVRDPDQFRQVAERSTVESGLPYTEVARCVEDRAALLPKSRFIPDETAQRTTYRLRGYGFTFEEITFEATPSGSRATILIAPNLNTKWHEDFARDRGAVVTACAAQTR